MIICYFGDSLTLGYGDPAGLGWAGRISGTLSTLGVDVTSYNLGIRKNTSTALLDRFEAEASRRKIEDTGFKFVFSFGVADVVHAQTTENSVAAAKAILTKAQGMGDVLMIGPSPTTNEEKNGMINTLSNALAELCTDLAVPFVPVFDAMLHSPTYQRALADNDGTHPAAMGYADLARHIMQSEPARDFFGLE
ncbi:GDSL-type esterase/lipase family protein [Pseudodesulfovibrio sediminis]|uniref:SGNH hydrolase-type esterase domain-containing protein n=1 Tax=Pseudodesulfovibrio sediminis TaxID=2810563 RepID=A0ABN6EZ56_9BACT|nr:GDSL-type esterase/lipase family protein [Pseudodesulfovibrio sediminis]BCS90073.1 hypothetical protein PSDVSF_33150 [Pseudodesulfovibrio sediminis]